MLGGLSPEQAENNVNDAKVAFENEKYLSKFKRKKAKYKEGMLVRIQSEKTVFNKGYRTNFNDEIFKIVKVKDKLPIPLYTLASLDDQEVLGGNFYQFQITPVRQSEHRIEKVLKKDEKTGRSFVKWEDYPERFNSWVIDSDLRQIKPQ